MDGAAFLIPLARHRLRSEVDLRFEFLRAQNFRFSHLQRAERMCVGRRNVGDVKRPETPRGPGCVPGCIELKPTVRRFEEFEDSLSGGDPVPTERVLQAYRPQLRE